MAATPAIDLLGLAERILDGVIPMPPDRIPRAAAAVARQALEEAVATQCDRLVEGLQRPTMRSQLIILRELGDRQIGGRAQVAWDGLSQACHHHAYDLQPTIDEVRGLVLLVHQVASVPEVNSNLVMT